MAYCTITDVQALNPKRTYGDTTTPTQTQVETSIDQIGNEIDSILLARGLTTPITTPTEFVAHLKQVNAYGAAALAEMAMFPEAGGPGATSHGSDLWKIYKNMTTRLEKGELPTAVETTGPRSFFTEHPTTEPTEDQPWRKPKFGKDKEF